MKCFKCGIDLNKEPDADSKGNYPAELCEKCKREGEEIKFPKFSKFMRALHGSTEDKYHIFDKLEDLIQLHEVVEIHYVVDGYEVRLSYDGKSQLLLSKQKT